MKQQISLTHQAIRTPRAAAVAGIIFSVLSTTSWVLIRLAIPEELRATNIGVWIQGNTATISLALTLVPFAGIAFLWFVGVVRSRLGNLEDQFFSTVFFGSGLLFLAMMFASAAIAGGILSSYAIAADTLMKSGVVSFGRAVGYVHDHQRVCHSHGGCVHAFVGCHLDAYPRDAALVCVPHLRSGVAAAGVQQPHVLVDSGLSGLGVGD